MARRTLDRHPKFKRLWRELKISRAQARGHLEFWWDSAHDAASEEFATGAEIEACAEWEGQPGLLFKKLIELRLADLNKKGTISVHDYWDHCPDYVHKRLKYRLDKMPENGGKRRRISAKPRTDPDPQPVPQPKTSKKADRIDAGIPAKPDRQVNEISVKSTRGEEIGHAGSLAKALLRTLPKMPTHVDPRKSTYRHHYDCYGFNLEEVIHFISSFETKGEKTTNIKNWTARLTKIGSTKGGMHWLRELCDHIQQSVTGNETKGISRLNNIPAFANKKTAEYLQKKKSA